MSDNALCAFKHPSLSKEVIASVGIQTGDNERFVHLWWEVPLRDICFHARKMEDSFQDRKYFPYSKGGEYRKWAGNDYHVVWWKNDGEEVKTSSVKTGHHYQQYADELKFKPLITWSRITTGLPAFRFKKYGYLSDMAGFCLYSNFIDLRYVVAFCNSIVATYYLKILAPTLNIMTGQVLALPFITPQNSDEIIEKSESAIAHVDDDWNSFELSWNFTSHPYVRFIRENKINRYVEDVYNELRKKAETCFMQLKANEEELNRIFIDIYGLQDEMTPEVEDKDITVHRIFDTKDDVPESLKGSSYVRTMRDEIVSLISYAIGCMFGRYSLDKEGLAYAGGEWDESLYQTFQPDADAIIPITDEEYGFDDDIVTRFIDFVRTVYGEETLEENLEFIAKALGNKGSSYREVLRNYFVNDFYKDHCTTYSVTGSGKRPIYWLFDSGKQNGFKALIYMHRYTPDTVGLIRSIYLQKAQTAIETAKQNAEYIISTSSSATEKAAASKKRDKYVKQLNELRPYYQALTHVALQRIDMDLDNGVKANYQLFQNVEISTEGKKQKIDLLAKI